MKVSVIMPTYNRPEMIFESISSYFLEGYENKELIIVNDGSTADYTKVEEACRHNNIQYVKLSHRGEPAALNSGIAMATGDLVCLLHDDDLFNFGSIEERAGLFRETKLVAVWGDSLKMMGSDRENLSLCTSGHPDVSRYWREDYIAFNTLMWKRVIHQVIGGFDESLQHEYDYDWKLRLHLTYCEAGRLGYIKSPVMINRIHHDRLTTIHSPEKLAKEHGYIHAKYRAQGFK